MLRKDTKRVIKSHNSKRDRKCMVKSTNNDLQNTTYSKTNYWTRQSVARHATQL